MDDRNAVDPAATDDTGASSGGEPAVPDPRLGEAGGVPAAPGSDGKADGGKEDAPLLSPGGDGKKEGKEDAPLLSPESGGEEAAEGAPETYEAFTLPEGFELEGDALTEVTDLFRGMNLSQKNAQRLVDYFTRRVIDDKAAGLEALAARQREWRAAVRQRPAYESERALALRGMRAVVEDEDEKALFKDSWLSDHPALWKIFVKVGRLVGEDQPPKGSGGSSPQPNINLMRFPNA